MIFENVKRKAEEQGMSIAYVERQAGLKNGTIHKWRDSSPMVVNLMSVAKVLNVKLEDLVKEDT